jgi:asparagine synthetase B (glutamine-hydrolysing)
MKDLGEQYSAMMRDFPFTNEVKNAIFAVYPDIKNPSWYEIITYLMFDLNKTLDFASMCHSVEVRVPYLDHELVEAALSIPMDKHIAKFGNKTILKQMLVDLGFDFGFIHRPKVGFSLHSEPYDLQELKNKAMAWYNKENMPKLDQNATPRQESYHQMTVLGLYFFNKIWGI